MRVAVYGIALNEAQHVTEWAASAAGADTILLADTGSTDDTVTLARDAGVTVHRISVQPFRFDTARNAALALLPADIDVCVPLDLDDRLQPGWVEEMRAAYRPGPARYLFHYEWQPGFTYLHDRIHSRHGLAWRLPAHEVIDGPGVVTVPTGVRVVQRQDRAVNRDARDSHLIELGAAENPTDPRAAYYWARQLHYLGRWVESRAEFQRYLTLPGHGQERSEACRFMARMVYPDNRERWLLRAASEAPTRREPWHDLTLHYRDTGQPVAAAGALARRDAITTLDEHNSFHVEAAAWECV